MGKKIKKAKPKKKSGKGRRYADEVWSQLEAEVKRG